jgi:glucose uptake protein
MIPTSSAYVLALLAISLFCWGMWANTQKAAGKWRFELYYVDFALGTLLAALLGAFTLGSMGDGFSFEDNLLISGKRHIALAAVSGVIFNLGNMLLVAAVSIAGLAVGFPLATGVAMIVSVTWTLVASPAGSVGLQAGGLGLVFVSVILVALAQRGQRLEATAGKRPDSGLKATLLAVCGGILLGLYQPALLWSQLGDFGLGAYGATMFFSIGVLLSTLLFSLYLINLPVQGEAVQLSHYWNKPYGQHIWGLAGGAMWTFGTLAMAMAGSAAPELRAGPALTLGIQYGSGLLAALCGLLVWKEFAAASGAVRVRLILGLALFLGGLLLTTFGYQTV